tara:strand:+ start:233 stop:1939 length:1707 start_codon:yes stop_codon:yes gene_type:complete
METEEQPNLIQRLINKVDGIFTVERPESIELDSYEGFEDLYRKFDAPSNRGLGFRKTVEQRVDDYDGRPGTIKISHKDKNDYSIKFWPDMGQDWVDEQNLSIYRAGTIVNAPLVLSPAAAAGKALKGKYFYMPPKTKKPPMQNVTPGGGLTKTTPQRTQIPSKSSSQLVQTSEGPKIRLDPGTFNITPDKTAILYSIKEKIDDEGFSIDANLKYWQAKAIPSDIHVDDSSPDSMLPILNELPQKLGYSISDVKTSIIKTKLVPPEIGTPYLQHARAFQKANEGTGRTLEDFPHLWYQGEPYVVKTRGKTSNVALEAWKGRVTRRKIGKLNRRRRLDEQSVGVKKGTAAYEKVRQLRELNVKELEAGLPRTRLRDAELDHINALRSVDYYTDGMPPDLTKQFYQKLGAEGLFTGDHASNLRVRQRAVHRRLWPLMKKRLEELGHRHTGFKTQQERFDYYNSINPKTGVTRIEEYAEVVYKIEELGDDMMNELLSVAKQKKLKGKTKTAPSDPVKEALIEIFGGGEDGIESYKAFMERLKDIPEKIDGKPSNLREQFILEEIVYVRHHLY